MRLSGAHVAGHLSLRGATLNGANHHGHSLAADRLRVDSVAFLELCTAAAAVQLIGAHLVVLQVDRSSPQLGDATGWQLGDLEGPVRTDRRAAAAWLDGQETAQPWQELAAVYERNGQPTDARWIRYQSAVRSTRHASWPGKLARTLCRITTGHGYYPLLTWSGWW